MLPTASPCQQEASPPIANATDATNLTKVRSGNGCSSKLLLPPPRPPIQAASCSSLHGRLISRPAGVRRLAERAPWWWFSASGGRDEASACPVTASDRRGPAISSPASASEGRRRLSARAALRSACRRPSARAAWALVCRRPVVWPAPPLPPAFPQLSPQQALEHPSPLRGARSEGAAWRRGLQAEVARAGPPRTPPRRSTNCSTCPLLRHLLADKNQPSTRKQPSCRWRTSVSLPPDATCSKSLPRRRRRCSR